MSNIIRSFLFVPADSEKKLAKAPGIGADALILDLEDAVLLANKGKARAMAADALKTLKTKSEIWIRINPLDTEYALEDLAAVIPAAPDGIMLPKPDGPVDLETLSGHIARLEHKHKLPPGKIRTLPVATETARAVFSLGAYPRTYLPRLMGLTWGAEDLAANIGATTNKTPDGEFDTPYQFVRAQTLLAAKASGVQAIDTLFDNFRDEDGLRMRARRAFAQGFTGMLAIHPAQVAVINESFMPNANQVEHAKAVIKAFKDNPGAGAVAVNGKMADIPHLKQAEAILAVVDRFGNQS